MTLVPSPKPRRRERFLHLTGRHGAHAAQVLGEDHVGLLAADQVRVQHVERLARVHPLAHGPVDPA